jgi:hypothetical protein
MWDNILNFLVPSNLLNTLFANTCNLYSPLKVRDHVYIHTETLEKFLCIPIFSILELKPDNTVNFPDRII